MQYNLEDTSRECANTEEKLLQKDKSDMSLSLECPLLMIAIGGEAPTSSW